jgi:hypothetical protein
MKITAMTTMAVLAGVAAQASELGQSAVGTVAVCMESGAIRPEVAMRAEETASKMFSGIGVKLDWRSGCPAEGLRISFSQDTPAKRLPHALAYALPYEGTHIVIFYDRVQRAVRPADVACLLAHVLVHEITHILQGIQRHSDQGVMKAAWDGSDYVAMTWQPLVFASEDINLIHRGLAGRAAQAALPHLAANTEIATRTPQ